MSRIFLSLFVAANRPDTKAPNISQIKKIYVGGFNCVVTVNHQYNKKKLKLFLNSDYE